MVEAPKSKADWSNLLEVETQSNLLAVETQEAAQAPALHMARRHLRPGSWYWHGRSLFAALAPNSALEKAYGPAFFSINLLTGDIHTTDSHSMVELVQNHTLALARLENRT